MAKERAGYPGGSRKHYIGPGRRVAEPHEVEALLQAVRDRKVYRPELELCLLLAADCGLRRMEICRCRFRDFQGDRLHVPQGKGNVSRYTVVTERVGYLMGRIRSRPGDRVWTASYSRLGELMEELVLRSGMPDDLTLHSLRHYFGTCLVAGGMPLPDISDLMGHRWLSSTAIYLHVTRGRFSRAAEIMETAKPAVLGESFLRIVDGGS